MLMELSTLVFLIRYSTSQYTKGGFTDASQRTALEWVQRYIHNFGGDPRLFDYYNEQHIITHVFFFVKTAKSRFGVNLLEGLPSCFM
jgi:hypothetical protein